MKEINLKTITSIIFSILVLSQNSFSQWIPQPVPDSIDVIHSFYFSGPDFGCAAGNIFFPGFSGRVLYTTNGGTTWNLASVPDSSRVMINLQFVNPVIGFCSGAYNLFFNDENKIRKNRYPDQFQRMDKDFLQGLKDDSGSDYKGLLCKTTDGGMTWNAYGVLPDNVYYLIGLYFVNSSTAYATASYNVSANVDDRIIKTTNGGLSWFETPMPMTVNFLHEIFFTNENNGYAVGSVVIGDTSRAVILRTTSAGASWTTQLFTNIRGFSSISFSDGNTGVVAGNLSDSFENPVAVYYRTTNAGNNWIQVGSPLFNISINDLNFVNETSTGLATGTAVLGSENVVFSASTHDNGATWTSQLIALSRFGISNFPLDPQNWYLGSLDNDEAKIFYTSNGGVGINFTGGEVPDEFSLSQNYPNPFNPFTKIKFRIPEASVVKIKIYNGLGKEINEIVNEILSAGEYEASFDAEGLTSGIYFYSMTAGNFSQTRKMLLIK